MDNMEYNAVAGDGGPGIPAKNLVKQAAGRIGLGIALMLIIQQVLVSVISVVAANMASWLFETDWFTWVMLYGPLYLVGFPVFLLLVRKLPNYQGGPLLHKKMNVKAFVLIFLGCIGIVFTFNMLTVLVSALMEMFFSNGVENPLQDTTSSSGAWMNLVALVVVAPLMEEFIFRHLLYKKLIGFGGKTYVFFSAVLFALMHPNIYQLIYAFLLGLIFGAVRYFTGQVCHTILLHFLINFVGSGVGVLLTSYAGETAMGIWALILMGMAAVGLVIDIWWLAKRRGTLVYEPGPIPVYKRSWLFTNFGMVLYMVLIAGLIVLTLLAG